MSALATPHSVFTNAINSDTIVPNEHVVSVETEDIAAVNGQAAEYNIVFTLVYPNSETKIVKIKFATDVARNTSIGNWITANSAPVA